MFFRGRAFYFVSLPHSVPDGTVGRGLISISTNIPSLRDGAMRFDFDFYQHSVPNGTSVDGESSRKKIKIKDEW